MKQPLLTGVRPHPVRRFFLGLTLLLPVLLASCSVAPIQEMSDARQAVQAAREAGVSGDNDMYLLQAEERLKSAEEKLKNRDYDAARTEALMARDEAIKAREASAPSSE